MEKMAWGGPKWGQDPDLADILGRMDLNFDNFYVLILWAPHFWISRSPDFPNLAWAGPGLDLGGEMLASHQTSCLTPKEVAPEITRGADTDVAGAPIVREL